MTTALSIIEEIYNLALNPHEDYYAQLEPLAANGELANHNSSMKVLFKLAMLVDEQARQIKSLEQKHRESAKSTMPDISSLDEVKPVVIDPTTPLNPVDPIDAKTTDQAGSNTDVTL